MKVLEEITAKTGIRFHYTVPLQGSVTVSFTALPVKQALERLFGPEADFMFRYPEGALRPVAVPQDAWVLGSVQGGDSQALQTTGGSDKAALGADASHPSGGPGPAIQGSNSTGKPAAAEDTQGERDLNNIQVTDHLLEMAQNEDPATRIQALSALSGNGKADEGTVDLALDAALTDKDASVREYAVRALANQRGPEAMGHLWQALQDPDPGVRIMVVDSVVPKDQGIALLQEALSDADEMVRLIAQERLKQIAN